jgi:hypothetical protein
MLLPSYAATTGPSATVVRALRWAVLHKEHNVSKEELLQCEGLVTEILPTSDTVFSSTDINSSPTRPERMKKKSLKD